MCAWGESHGVLLCSDSPAPTWVGKRMSLLLKQQLPNAWPEMADPSQHSSRNNK